MKKKDKKIIEDAERDGIPIFVLTAKDKLSVDTILDYEVHCIRNHCDEKHNLAVHDRLNEFEAWQRDNTDKVKLPPLMYDAFKPESNHKYEWIVPVVIITIVTIILYLMIC